MVHIGKQFRAFRDDERGIALIFVSIMLPAIIGFALLVIDMSRAGNLHNDLQKGADSFAIAGASELDGRPDAIIHGDRAIANLVDNTYVFSAAGVQQTLTAAGISRRYLRNLPANDSTPIPASMVITDEANDAGDAQFVEVTVTPVGFTAIFPASFLGGTNSFNIGAIAVAGFNSGVCNFTPVFICNPYEQATDTTCPDLYTAANSRECRRRLIELRAVGGGADYFPGNFGFLDSPLGNGARALAEMIASSRPQNCYSTRGVDTKTGQNSGPVKGAFNIRFGIKEPGTGSWNSAAYGPAENVRKGAVKTSGNANQCSSSNQLTWGPPNQELPADACFATGSCPYMGGRMSGDQWNFSNYWSVNHGATSYPAEWSASGADLPTRYEVYRHEIEYNGGTLVANVSAGGEVGTPPSQCGTPVTSVDRRLIYGAILNCQQLEAAGYNLGGHEVGLPVEAFASFFITQPVRKEPHSEYDASVFVELVDVTGGGQGTLNNFLRDEVQLYR